MKKIISLFGLVLVFSMLYSTAQAQTPTPTAPYLASVSPVPPSPPVAPTPPQAQDPFERFLFSPELIMKFQSNIDLTDVQRKSIIEEVQSAQQNFTIWHWDLQNEMASLENLLKENAVDEGAVNTQLDKILDLEREIKRAQVTLMVRIKNQLTEAQQKELRHLRSTSREMGRGNG